ncbi:MAG: winged helix-turn-helix domain-containing protein [Pseudomonadota bacterium]
MASDENSAGSMVYRFADIAIDRGQRRVWRGDVELDLPKRSFDLLDALVEAAPNSLSTNELMERVWGQTVVSLATVAKRVELVRDVLGDDSHRPRYIALVRGHGYRLIPEVRSTAPSKKRPWLAFAAGAAALIVISMVFVFRASNPVPPDKSIAVLPFVSMTTDPAGEVFADGLTEELSHVLARLSDLKVAGRTSSFHFKGRNEDLREIGAALGVAHVLEGSVRQSGDVVRITAQLISTDDGFHLWSESYDRRIDDILIIQRDIAEAVAAKLEATMLDRQALDNFASVRVDPRAYAKYLQTISLAPHGKIRGLGEAQMLAEEVTQLAPDFAPGWNRLASIHARRLFFKDPGYELSPDVSIGVVKNAIEIALALDPQSGPAHANLGIVTWNYEHDIEKAASQIEKALTLAPHDLEIVSFAAEFAKHIGQLDDAIALEEMLLTRDPLCSGCRYQLARSYLFARRYDAARAQFRTLQSMEDGYHWTLGVIHLLQDRPQLARASFRKHEDFEVLKVFGEAMSLHDLGQREEASRLLADAASRWGSQLPLITSRVFAYVGDEDSAIAWLETALTAESVVMRTNLLHPQYDGLRNRPAWRALMEREGRSAEQLASIEFSIDETIARLNE